MTKEELFQLEITALDDEIMKKASRRWDSISKPIDGLGDFEKLITKLSGIRGELVPFLDKAVAIVMCADNGIIEEGVSQTGYEVTGAVAKALGNGSSSLCTLVKPLDVEIIPVNIAIRDLDDISGVINRKLANGSKNFLKMPAMSIKETLEAISIGMELVKEYSDRDIIITGEMGIGNTTTSTAVMCSLLDVDSNSFTGRGAGLDNKGLDNKRKVIFEGIEKYSSYKELDSRERAINTLAALGGFDIAGLVGVYIGAALHKLPVIIDGLISATAALVAEMIIPGVKNYMIASHMGRENGIKLILDKLELTAYIKGNMALGEGTGAAMLLPLMRQCLYFYNNATVFEDIEVEAYERFES